MRHKITLKEDDEDIDSKRYEDEVFEEVMRRRLAVHNADDNNVKDESDQNEESSASEVQEYERGLRRNPR